MALIYIIEDDENIREIEEFALKSAGYKTHSFACIKDFYRGLFKTIPDCCLVDLMLPDGDGNELVKNLRKKEETNKMPIIMVTAKSTEIDLVRGIENGADDYIKKPFSVMELLSRVKALLRRTQIQDIEKLVLDDLVLNNNSRSVSLRGEPLELTYKEYELLFLLLRNKDIVLKRNIILDSVWGSDFIGESRTLDMHIKTLRQKLKHYGERIKTVRNVGYVLK